MRMIADDGLSRAENYGKCDSAVRRYWKGMNERNVEFALEQFADDIMFQVPFHNFGLI